MRTRHELVKEIANILNCHSRENTSNTPDYVLAEFMVSALESFESSVCVREVFHGRNPLFIGEV